MNNKDFVVNDSCKRKQAEHILKKLKDFPAMSLLKEQEKCINIHLNVQ